jgi:hypothetical protein
LRTYWLAPAQSSPSLPPPPAGLPAERRWRHRVSSSRVLKTLRSPAERWPARCCVAPPQGRPNLLRRPPCIAGPRSSGSVRVLQHPAGGLRTNPDDPPSADGRTPGRAASAAGLTQVSGGISEAFRSSGSASGSSKRGSVDRPGSGRSTWNIQGIGNRQRPDCRTLGAGWPRGSVVQSVRRRLIHGARPCYCRPLCARRRKEPWP